MDITDITNTPTPREETEETIKGYVDHIIWRSPANGYTVMVLVSGGREVTCVGYCRDVSDGENLEAQGKYVRNATYGKQFEIRTYHVVPPADRDSCERYLGSGAIKGVGVALAARIVKTFGDDTLRIIDEEPERLAEIKGISLKKAQEIAVQVAEKKELREAMLFLGGYHISQNLAVKIYEQYGQDLYRVMKENPYRLAEDITGVGFQKADQIAMISGIQKDSVFRLRCGLLYTLQQTIAEGHCYFPREELIGRAARLLEAEEELVEDQLPGLQMDRKIVLRQDRVYLTSYYYAELNCAHMLLERNLLLRRFSKEQQKALEERFRAMADELKMEVDELQLQAAVQAVENGIFILSGGPGTGKTTTINMIIRYLMEEGEELLLAAPTGRAAKRMSEATGFAASTIHRLLEIGGMDDETGRASFQKNQDSPLEADTIIIDETSMVDIQLFQALLKATVPGTRLILVGDVDQLPSVGAGQVLKDVMEGGRFAGVLLTKIFRQSEGSDIVVNAHRINHGEQIRLDTNSKDFLFLERNDEDVIKNIATWMIREKLPGYCDTTMQEIQVLTPMRKGNLGCIELNRFLQAVLNPPDPVRKQEHLSGDNLFREGDKVMQIKNNYKLEWEIPGNYGIPKDSGVGVFNGDMGRIRSIDEGAGFLTVEFDDARVVKYPMNGLDELELAYATTIHKSQGSEYPAVIIPVLEVPHMLCYRNLLYTGVTRAKKCVVLLGSSETVRTMIDNSGENRRYTSLAEMIAECEGGAGAG